MTPEIQYGWVSVGDVRFRPDRVDYYERIDSRSIELSMSGKSLVVEMTVEQMDEVMAKVTHIIYGERT